MNTQTLPPAVFTPNAAPPILSGAAMFTYEGLRVIPSMQLQVTVYNTATASAGKLVAVIHYLDTKGTPSISINESVGIINQLAGQTVMRIPVANGIITQIHFYVNGASNWVPQRGQCYVICELVDTVAPIVYSRLIAHYIDSINPIIWYSGQSLIEDPLSGRGFITSFDDGDSQFDYANGEMTFVPTPGYYYKVKALTMQLATDATVANRYLGFKIFNNTPLVTGKSYSTTPQATSTTDYYSLGNNTNGVATLVSSIQPPVIGELVLFQNQASTIYLALGTDTANRGTTDQVSAAEILVEQFIYPW